MSSPPSPSISPPIGPVLFYDGECGLCNAATRFLLRIDKRRALRFAPLQGSTAQEYLRARGLPTADFDSMILVRDWPHREQEAPLFRTDAALGALQAVGGAWRLLLLLRVVPRPLRDLFYRAVARLRYRVFGPYHPRPLPPEWTIRFLP